MAEMFYRCDSQGNIIGSVSRNEAHTTGAWHKAVHIYLINHKKQLLMQLRAHNKDIAPDVWDISVGGHIDYGETSLSTACREVAEELGIETKESEFVYMFTNKEILKNGNYISKEFVDVFVIEKDVTEHDVKLQDSEVAEFSFVDLKDFVDNVKAKHPKFTFHTTEYKKIIPMLKKRYNI